MKECLTRPNTSLASGQSLTSAEAGAIRFENTAKIWPHFSQSWQPTTSATAAHGPWHSSYDEHDVHMKNAAKLVSWRSVHQHLPSALAASCIRKPNQAQTHCFPSLLTVCRWCCRGPGCREHALPACWASSRLRGHGKIELLTKERVVGSDNIWTDAIEPYPILVQFQGRVWKWEEEGKENPEMW